MSYISSMFKQIALPLAVIFCGFSQAYAQDSLLMKIDIAPVANDTISADSVIVEHDVRDIDDPILDQWDSLVTDTKKNNVTQYLDTAVAALFRKTPTYTDEEYIEMMKVLDDNSPFSLDYNKRVRQSINYYTSAGKSGTSRVLGKSELYFPMMEEILYNNGLPLEFKYLSIVESALDPRARSRVGATGLWQFMYPTAKENGLKIDSYVDERMDPIKSTKAACKYLNRLYKIYGDWNLVLAAYNSGPGNVNKAIRRSGGYRDFWQIKDYLPRETRGYVPSFIAVNFVMSHAEKFNIFPIKPGLTYADVDTVHVHKSISFDHIKLYMEISTIELEYLNPIYYRNIIPESQTPNAITLPRDLIGDFISNEQNMYGLNPKKVAQSKSSSKSNDGGESYYYKVRSGDVLGVIAQRNNVSLRSLTAWNNIRGNKIYPGQKLLIKGSKANANNVTASGKIGKNVATSDGDKRYHTIQRGDTLWDIAKLYSGVSVSDLKRMNYNLNDKRLKPGQKIIIGG
ncbi:MAG: membrane-bound lytic murein transglycosylase D [Patiriisocius sp.]|jgi:membrane-bound lytic murein transglycosylase D